MTRPSDDELVDLLHNALAELDHVPRHVVEAARAAFEWRTVDAELAALLYDSATSQPAGVRAETASRQLSFAADGVEIEILVRDAELEPRLDIQIVPPAIRTIQIRDGQTTATATTDELGRCTVPVPRAARIQLLIDAHDGRQPIATPWLSF